ncbi:hypothetical protein [Streptomyces sp. AC555_RSS877]|uniref:hypothetical protein n=1 Tax=Streptomyces sp. AC555_RSS877 TaxID=2823688 RepID=UPI001C251472|nr:hypothetical protein [Streptomyces sp. AC555_RSS877]
MIRTRVLDIAAGQLEEVTVADRVGDVQDVDVHPDRYPALGDSERNEFPGVGPAAEDHLVVGARLDVVGTPCPGPYWSVKKSVRG